MFARPTLGDILCLMYTFSNIHKNLVIRNVLQSVETSIQDRFSFSKNAALQNILGYLYKTPQPRRNVSLSYTWHKNKQTTLLSGWL